MAWTGLKMTCSTVAQWPSSNDMTINYHDEQYLYEVSEMIIVSKLSCHTH